MSNTEVKTYVRLTDEGTEKTVISIVEDEAAIKYYTDGVETGFDVIDADSPRLGEIETGLVHDGYALDSHEH